MSKTLQRKKWIIPLISVSSNDQTIPLSFPHKATFEHRILLYILQGFNIDCKTERGLLFSICTERTSLDVCKGIPKNCLKYQKCAWSFHSLFILFYNLLKTGAKSQNPVIPHRCSVFCGRCFRDTTVCMSSPRHHGWRATSTCPGLWTTSHRNFIEWKSTTLDLFFSGSLSARRQLCLEIHQEDDLEGILCCDPGLDCSGRVNSIYLVDQLTWTYISFFILF